MGLLELKKSESHWIQVGEDSKGNPVEFLIDYPKRDQAIELESLLRDAYGVKSIKISEAESDRALDTVKLLAYKRLLIDWSIREIRGLKYEDGSEVKELTMDILWELVKDPTQANEIYEKINTEIDFNIFD